MCTIRVYIRINKGKVTKGKLISVSAIKIESLFDFGKLVILCILNNQSTKVFNLIHRFNML